MKKPLPVKIEMREGDLSKAKRQISLAFSLIFATAEKNIVQRHKQNIINKRNLTTKDTKV